MPQEFVFSCPQLFSQGLELCFSVRSSVFYTMTRVSFTQYFWEAFFGILAGGFVMTFFFAPITEVWSNGEREKLWGWKSLLSLLLFISSFFTQSCKTF